MACDRWSDYAGMALWAFVLSEALSRNREHYLDGLHDLLGHVESAHSGVLPWFMHSVGLHFLARVFHRASLGERAAERVFSRAGSRRHSTGEMARTMSAPATPSSRSSRSPSHASSRSLSHSPNRPPPSCSPIYTYRFWQILWDAFYIELGGLYDRDGDGRVSTWEVVSGTAHGAGVLVEGLLISAVDHGLVAFSIYAVVHMITLRTLVYGILVALTCLVMLIWSLLLLGSDWLPGVIRIFKQNEVYSAIVIFGAIFCIIGVCLFLIIGALYDIGSGSVEIWTSITAASAIDNTTVLNLYKNGTALLELGFGKLESNYEAEEWWPVVSGVRQSVMEGKEGLALLDDTFDDLSKVYNKTYVFPDNP